MRHHICEIAEPDMRRLAKLVEREVLRPGKTATDEVRELTRLAAYLREAIASGPVIDH